MFRALVDKWPIAAVPTYDFHGSFGGKADTAAVKRRGSS
jgi:hypothetical protein